MVLTFELKILFFLNWNSFNDVRTWNLEKDVPKPLTLAINTEMILGPRDTKWAWQKLISQIFCFLTLTLLFIKHRKDNSTFKGKRYLSNNLFVIFTILTAMKKIETVKLRA